MTEIFLAPCSKSNGDGRAYDHMQRTVVDGVPRSTYQKHTENPIGEKIGVWGVTEGLRSAWEDIDSGDYLLFYVGNRRYGCAARVMGTEDNFQLAEELWSDYSEGETGSDDPGDPWNLIIYLEDVTEIRMPSTRVHDPAGHSIDYPMRFMPLNQDGRDKIVGQYGSVAEFVTPFSD